MEKIVVKAELGWQNFNKPYKTITGVGLTLKHAVTEAVGPTTGKGSVARTPSEGGALPSRGTGLGPEGCVTWG